MEEQRTCTKCGRPMEPIKQLVENTIYGCENGHLYMTVTGVPWHYEGFSKTPGVYPMDRVDDVSVG